MRFRMTFAVWAALPLIFVLAALHLAQAQPAAASSDDQQLRALLTNYVKAVDTLDPNLISRIWSHSPDASFIHPRGTDIGFEQIRDDLYMNIMGLFSRRDLMMETPTFHIYGDTAWSQMTWTFHATFKDSGQNITTTGRETQIYRKEDGTWRIVHVHYSGPPDTRPLKGF